MNHNRYTLVHALREEGFSYREAFKYVEEAYRIVDAREMNPLTMTHREAQSNRFKLRLG